MWDMVTIENGKKEYVNVWSATRESFYSPRWKYFKIDHSPINHHRFPSYVRDVVKWYFINFVFHA